MAVNPAEQTAGMLAKLEATTGKPLAQWTRLVAASGLEKHGQVVNWLKRDHGVTHGYANLIAHSVFNSDAASQTNAGTDLVSAMFDGDKASLRPIFDRIMTSVRAFGNDVEESPKKGYLSLRRSTQFATLHPSTKSRFDVGLKLKGVAPAGRLEPAGSWNAMVTHRVRLESAGEVDGELAGWLRKAYDMA